jgi:cytochrome d ubiquinol oxidase subunit II
MYSAEFWFVVLSFAVLMYVTLDGFDLGLGILYPWFESDKERSLMMSSIAHIWDGNETWLVFGGVVLFAAFPQAYAMLLSSMYMPVMIMLLALVMRGAAFEYRFKGTTSVKWWDRAFALGSSVAAFCQGFILGKVVQGVSSSPMELSTVIFPIITGFSVMAGYALLACGWMIIKKTADMQLKAAALAKTLIIVVLVAFAVVSLYSLIAHPQVAQRWLQWPNVVILAPLPVLALALGFWIYQHCGYLIVQSRAGKTNLPVMTPFVLTVILFGLGFVGLWIGMHPFLIPGQLSMYQALAPKTSLAFITPGVVILLPVILLYTLYGYKVFAGKTRGIAQIDENVAKTKDSSKIL